MGRALTVAGVLSLLLGALVCSASAASSSFDLGEDLELGSAVHGADVGPIAASLAALALAGIAVLAWFDPGRASKALVLVALGAVALTATALVVLAIADRPQFDEAGLQPIPFVVAFFSLPALATAGLLWLAAAVAGQDR